MLRPDWERIDPLGYGTRVPTTYPQQLHKSPSLDRAPSARARTFCTLSLNHLRRTSDDTEIPISRERDRGQKHIYVGSAQACGTVAIGICTSVWPLVLKISTCDAYSHSSVVSVHVPAVVLQGQDSNGLGQGGSMYNNHRGATVDSRRFSENSVRASSLDWAFGRLRVVGFQEGGGAPH